MADLDMTVIAARADGTYVIDLEGVGPYHVIATDPLYAAAAAAAAGMTLAPEPPPPAVAPVERFISDRQFAQGLAVRGLITQAEALEWVGPGTLPAAIAAFIAGLPQSERFAAEMVLRGATAFDLDHPMTGVFASAVGMDAAALRAFWAFCASL